MIEILSGETESKPDDLRLVDAVELSRRLESYYSINGFVQLMCPHLRIPVEAVDWNQGTSRTFRCPIHPDAPPTATLSRSPNDGAWTLKCPHVKAKYVVWQLPQVYAVIQANAKKVRRGQLAMWSLKLLDHSGVIVPPSPPALLRPEIPNGLSGDALKVLRVAIDLTCYRLAWTGEIDFPFAQRLGMSWSRLNVHKFIDALEELVERKILFKVGEYPVPHKRPGHIYSLLPYQEDAL